MIASLKGLLVAATAALARIAVAFLILLLMWDASYRIVLQLAPTSWFFSLDRVIVLSSGEVTVIYRSSRIGNLAVGVVSELIGPDDRQPCASSGKRIIETDTDVAVIPIARILPDCDWSALEDGRYHLQLTGNYPAGGAYDKSITRRSENAILVEGGRIVGATALDRRED